MIYQSDRAPVSPPQVDLFTYLLSPGLSSAIPPDLPVLGSASNPALRLALPDVLSQTLRLSSALSRLFTQPDLKPIIPSPAKPGQTQEEHKVSLLVFSPNSVAFALAVLSALACPEGLASRVTCSRSVA